MTRVALISDVHGNLPALEALETVLDSADEVLCGGDLIGYYPFPNEAVEAARERGWRCVRGNHENALTAGVSGFNRKAAEALRWTAGDLDAENRDWLTGLPAEQRLSVDGDEVAVTHGAPGDIHRYVRPDVTDFEVRGMLERVSADVLVLGHTHVPMLREVDEGILVNPGSVGQPRDGDPGASAAVLEGGEVEFVRRSYDVDGVQETVLDSGLPGSLGDRLARGR